jgi:hypothetical protein
MSSAEANASAAAAASTTSSQPNTDTTMSTAATINTTTTTTTTSTATSTPNTSIPIVTTSRSSSDDPNEAVTIYGPRLAADIGGTLAKLVFFKHVNVPPMPDYVESDSEVLAHVPLPLKLDPKLSIESESCRLCCFRQEQQPTTAKQKKKKKKLTYFFFSFLKTKGPFLGGELRFLRIPSSDVPNFIDFIESKRATANEAPISISHSFF